jgi:hypothetical protein
MRLLLPLASRRKSISGHREQTLLRHRLSQDIAIARRIHTTLAYSLSLLRHPKWPFQWKLGYNEIIKQHDTRKIRDMNYSIQALFAAAQSHPMIASFGLAGALVFFALPYIAYKFKTRSTTTPASFEKSEREHDLSWIGGEAYIHPTHFIVEEPLLPKA